MFNKSKYVIVIIIILCLTLLSCSSVDLLDQKPQNINNYSKGQSQLSLLTYNIKAIYDKDQGVIDSLMSFVNNNSFDVVIFQELFDESTRDEIIERADSKFYNTIISRVDYNSFPEFLFQDSGLFMMSRFPRVDLSRVEFGCDINNSNGIIHKILEKEISKTNDFLANKSVMGALFNIDSVSKLYVFTTHVQAIGTQEVKEKQLKQIYNFIRTAVDSVVNSGIVKAENLSVILAGDFNSDAYNHSRFSTLIRLLGNPRDIHMELNGRKKEYTFGFRGRKPSRRFDYVFVYDNLGNIKLKSVNGVKSSVFDVKSNNKSISDHLALSAKLQIK